MNDFKVGDPVEYVGNTTAGMVGKRGTVVDPLSPNPNMVWFDHGGDEPYGAYSYNLRIITPAPDVLTIDRAELPEVVEVHGFLRADEFDYGLIFSATQHRKRALAQLAVSEFLAAREKAEQEAADQHAAILNKRRDELAVELFDQPGYKAHPEPFNYADATPVVRAAIDRIIQLEGQVKK